MKKRLLTAVAVFIVVVMCFSLVACTGESGKSAYEIAVENGFVGSEQEWLASLVGKDGSDGKDASNLDINDIYQAYLDINPDATFEEFLSVFLGGQQNQTQYAVSKAIKSIVSVYCEFTQRGSFGGEPTTYVGAGAGVVYQIQGDDVFIITNYHVVYDRDSITPYGMASKITLFAYGYAYSGYSIEATFVGGSISKDIAVVKASLESFPCEISAVQVADSNDITLGEQVIAIGNPLAEGIAVTTGIISVDSEEIEMEALDSASNTITLRVMRTDTPINSGNSGGGLFNAQGELVGIVNAKTVSSSVDNVGYAIPVNVAVGLAEAVLTNDSKKCLLGITVTAITTSTYFNTVKNRVEIIETITVDELASTLVTGKLEVGDVIVGASLNDGETQNITRIFQLPDFLFKVRPGDTVNLKILRNDVPMTISLTPSAMNFSSI